MATELKNLSTYNPNDIPNGNTLKIGIVVSEWNKEITGALFNGAYVTLLENGVEEQNIQIQYVPGSFELPISANLMLQESRFNAIICLGCVIQGETRHFEFICQAVANGILQVSFKHDTPVVFGVLTTDNLQQALDRSGGKHGNKGIEAAITALKMGAINKTI